MKRQELRQIMLQAWQFVKRNGFEMSKALTIAWANYKLKQEMMIRIVKFYYQKVDGTIREAYGTLSNLPATSGQRKSNDTVQVYFDTEKQEFRCYKRANLVY